MLADRSETTDTRPKLLGYLTVCASLIAVTGFGVDLLVPTGPAVALAQIALVLVGYGFEDRRVTLMLAMAATALTVLGYFASEVHAAGWIELTNRVLTIALIWIIAAFILHVRRTEVSLRDSVNERNLLIREVHHRVQNNLQMIASLISLEARKSRSHEAKDSLRSITGRVQALGATYRQLNRDALSEQIELVHFLRCLCDRLLAAHSSSERMFEINVLGSPVLVSSEMAADIGLVVNECVLNAFEHAFAERGSGTVGITVSTSSSGLLSIAIADDGDTPSKAADGEDLHSVGIALCHATVHKHGGELKIDKSAGWTIETTWLNELSRNDET